MAKYYKSKHKYFEHEKIPIRSVECWGLNFVFLDSPSPQK